MEVPLDKLVLVDEVRPSSFYGNKIPVTEHELYFFQDHIPFSLDHEYDACDLTEKINLLTLLFHRAIKLETSFVSRDDKEGYLDYEVEKITPLLKPLGLKPQRFKDQTTTLFGLKYLLSEAMETLSEDFKFGLINRTPDYSYRTKEIKQFSIVDDAMSVFDNTPYEVQPRMIFGSATNMKHNALKSSFSDIDMHLIAIMDSFQEYKELLSFVDEQNRRAIPLSVNIIPEAYAQAYFIADTNGMFSPDKSILSSASILYPLIPDEIVVKQRKAALAQNLLRTKKALVDDEYNVWDVSRSAFNANGKKSNLVFAYMKELSSKFSADYIPFVSSDNLLPVKTARTILTNQSVEASRVFKKYYRHDKRIYK